MLIKHNIFDKLAISGYSRGSKLFFLKINNGFYMKANCINYKLLFTEFKKIN